MIYLKHGETSGILCHDEQSTKRSGDPAYVRIYKGNDDADIITTNNLFEIEQHNQGYSETVSQQGSFLTWKNAEGKGSSGQIVRFRHLNTGRLLAVRPMKSDDNAAEPRASARPKEEGTGGVGGD